MVDKIYSITKEALTEFQTKMKTWVRSVTPTKTSDLDNDSDFLDQLALADIVALNFSASSTYAVGEYVIYEKKLYRCTTAVQTAGDWSSSNWTQVKSTDIFQGSAPGLVPAAESGDADKVLKGDGTWGEAGSSVRISYDSVTEELHMDFSPHPGEVEIGGRWYPYVQIGNQLWLVENLDYKWSDLIVGSSDTSTSEQRANYFNDDSSTYGVNGNKYGLLYNWVAVKYLNDNRGTLLPSGWHVPSRDESDTLISFVGGSSIAGLKLKSATGWNSEYKGTNDYGFTAYPAGYRHRLGDYIHLGDETRFWNSTATSYPEYQFFYLVNSDQSFNSGESINYQFSIRLVKTIT